ncbi:hypothetical protein C8Q74DRAFT_141944 [Fomes fomentarius]|nr:hypothetical protein C8Q74DRAFT_141944 [Fomes fomentarius]
MQTWFRFYPVLPLLYVGHVWFRRRVFRGRTVLPWPPATSLKLWELYTSAGFCALLETERRRLQTHWVDDRNLGIIQLGAFFLWRDNHHRLAGIKAAQFDKSVPGYLAWYPRHRDGILAELSWWNNHMWSSEQTCKIVLVVLFNTTAAQTADREVWNYLKGKDWDKTATFFANSIHSSNGMRNKVSTIDLKYCKVHAV